MARNENGANVTTGTSDQGGDMENNAPAGVPDEIKGEFTRMLNGAQSAQWSRMNKVFEQKLEEQKNQMADQFRAMMEERAGKKDAGADKGTGTGSREVDDAIAQLKAENEARVMELNKKLEAAENLRQQERNNAQRTEEKARLSAALQEKGVANIRGAAAILYTEDKRIGRDESGRIVYKAQRDGYEEELSLEAGLDEWLKSAEGKYYAPAVDVRGSGRTGGKAGKPTSKMSKRELKREFAQGVLRGDL